MVSGINKYDGKDRRRQRLRNHVAKDLGSPKYRQRVMPCKKIEGVDYQRDVYGPYPEDAE